ncbi:MAG TPA: DUF4173 domain-containing protein [Candidatus Acidoferrum sp.]|nr:DUF4173 domain-containing protein [Candidatus Acidoferrum sp.]
MSGESFTHIGQLSADGNWRWDGASWRPVVSHPLPHWINLKMKRGATWLTVLAVAASGLMADQALRSGTFGLGASLTLGLIALALIFPGRIGSLESRALAGVSVLFAAWMTVRASPWLLWPDLAMSFALAGLAASVTIRGSLLDMGIAEAAARSGHALIHFAAGAGFALKPLMRTRNRMGMVAPVARGALIAAPIATLVALLLAAADPVFASFFKLNLDFNQLILDVAFVMGGALVAAGVLRLAAAEPLSRVDGPAWRLGAIEGLVVLTVLDAIFAAFAVAQAIAAAGAAGDALRAAGVTYAEYARSGFFELLWVAGIRAVVLILFSRITSLTQRSTKRAFQVLSLVAIGLTLLIVLVAFQRLRIYEDAYGFTMLRLYSHIFAVWIALVFLLMAADFAGLFPRRRWLVGATSVSAMAVLLALNVINPEAVVVSLNLDRAQATHKIDAEYLSTLSNDATPTLLASGSPAVRPIACKGPRSYAASPAAFNWSDATAATARRTLC